MRTDLVAGVVALATVSILLPITTLVLRRGGMYDHPSSRSSHSIPTPRGAGAAQVAGMGVSWGAIGWVPFPGMLAPIAFSFLGLLDDLRAQRPSVRLVVQVTLGVLAIVVLSDASASSLTELVVLVAGAGLFVVSVNSANFMDGINGISAIHGTLFGAAYWWLLADIDSEWAPMAAALVGASVAFLPWNWGRSARLFLGDSGSYLLGALMASFSIIAIDSGIAPILALAPLVIYLGDVLATLGWRAMERKSLFAAHKDHVYQQLVQLGLSHPTVALTVAGFTSLAVCLAWIGNQFEVSVGVVAILLSVLVGVYLLLPLIVTRSKQHPPHARS